MEEPLIRLLRAEEIECRIATVSEKGVSLLLFKDARVDQKILDETFTPFGWKRTHPEGRGCGTVLLIKCAISKISPCD